MAWAGEKFMASWAVPARASSLRTLRALLRGWLTRVGWPRAAGQDVVLAVHAAVSNAVSHADLVTGELIDVSVWVTTPPTPRRHLGHARPGRQIVAQVRDYGRWRPRAAGHGLALMTGLMERVQIDADLPLGGTEVTLISPPGPPTAYRSGLALAGRSPWLGPVQASVSSSWRYRPW